MHIDHQVYDMPTLQNYLLLPLIIGSLLKFGIDYSIKFKHLDLLN